jgi:hypothetical protein
MKRFFTYGLLLLVLLSASRLIPQTAQLHRLESELLQQRHGVEKIQSSLLLYKIQADSIALLINPLKTKTTPSFFERRRLDGLLSDAQQIAGRQERAMADWNTAQSRQAGLVRQLDSLYTAGLDSISQALQRASESDKLAILAQIAQWQEKRRLLQNDLNSELYLNVQTLTVETDDLPEDIEQKADFLRDWADKLLKQMKQISERAGQVKKEIVLRRRMSDLVSDMRMFDSQDETVSSTTGLTLNDGVRNGMYAGYEKNSDVAALQHPADALLNFDFRTLPVYSLDDFQNLLEGEKHKLSRQVDSLSALAQAFDVQAQALRATLRNRRQ